MSDRKYWGNNKLIFSAKKIEYKPVGSVVIEKIDKKMIGKNTEENKKAIIEYKKIISFIDSKKQINKHEFDNKLQEFTQQLKQIYNAKYESEPLPVP